MLSACSSVKEDLGLGRSPPDEFAVVDRPPLAMPPDYGLRPPEPGAPRPQEVDSAMRANDTLFGAEDKKQEPAGHMSAAEKALLEQAGANKASSDIRVSPVRFFEDDKTAMADMKKCADLEKKGAI